MCHLQKQSRTLLSQTVSKLCEVDTSVTTELMYVVTRLL